MSSSFLGGAGTEIACALALAADGGILVSGSTASANFPVTPGAFDGSLSGSKDVFAARLSADVSALEWGTYLGGIYSDEAFSMAVDPGGGVILAGVTNSAEFPTTADALDRTYGGNADAFLARLNPSGSTLTWSSFVGGSQLDEAWEVAIDPSGRCLLAGPTRSPDFPTTAGSFDRTYNGEKDVFLTLVDVGALASVDVHAVPALPLLAGPNPFRDAIELEIDLARPSRMTVLVLDASGRRVKALRCGRFPAGQERLTWDGCDQAGRPVATGVYFLRVEVDDAVFLRKVVRCR